MALAFLLLVAGVAFSCTTIAAQPTGLQDWCSFGNHSTSQVCSSAKSTCQTSDTWWTNASVCAIPGTVGNYPANFDASYLVCGGAGDVKVMPLSSLDGIPYGSIFIFRDYFSRLFITVALDGAKDGQWFYQVPNPGIHLVGGSLTCSAALQQDHIPLNVCPGWRPFGGAWDFLVNACNHANCVRPCPYCTPDHYM